MKKINILLIAIVLLALTLPVMGQVTFSGEVKGGFYQPIQTAAPASVVNANAKLSASFTADENVSGTVALAASDAAFSIDTASANINLLGALGVKDVPLAMTLTIGKIDSDKAGVVDYTHYGFEKVIGLGTTKGFDNMRLDTKVVDLVTIRTAIAPASYSGNLIQFVVGASGTVGPVSAELFYGNSKRPNGDIGIGAGFSQALGDLSIKVGGTTQIPLIENGVGAWGAGTAVAYTTLVKFTASAKGDIAMGTATGNALQGIGLGIESTPIALLTVKAGMTLDTRTNADILDGIELFGQLNLGKYTLGLGYNWAANDTAGVLKNDAFSGKAATPNTNGGITVKSSVSF